MRLIQLGIRFDGADDAKRQLRDVAEAEKQVVQSAEAMASAQQKIEQSTKAVTQAQQQAAQQTKTIASLTREAVQATSALTDSQQSAVQKYKDGSASIRAAMAETEQSAGSLTQKFAIVGGVVSGAALAAVAGVTAIVNMAKPVLDFADNLDTMASRAGVGVEAFQRLGYAAKLSNVDMGALTGAVNTLQDRIAGNDKSAVAAFQTLGLNFEKVRDMDMVELLLSISDSIKGVTDHNEQIKIMNDLFGKQGKELLPLVTGNLREVMQAAHVMSAETVKGLASTNDSLDTIKNSLMTIFGNLLNLTRVPWVISIIARGTSATADDIQWAQGKLGSMWDGVTGMLGRASMGAYSPLMNGSLPPGPTDPGRGAPSFLPEDSPFGAGRSLGDYLADQRKKNPRLKSSQWPWPSYGMPGDVSGRTGDYDYSFWNVRNTASVDWFGPGTSLQDAAMKYGMAGGAPVISGRGSSLDRSSGSSAMSAILSSIASALPRDILSAITGGGSISAAIGGSIGSSIFGASSPLTKDIGKGLGSMFGSSGIGGALGNTIGSLIPGLGSLVGAGLGKLFGKLFGPSQGKKDAIAAEGQINQLQAQLLAQYGSKDTLRALGQEAGVDITAAWGDKNVAGLQHFQASTQDFQAAVSAQQQLKDIRAQLVDTYGSLDNIKDLSAILGVNLASAFGPDAKGVQGLQTMQTLMGQFGKQQDALNGAIGKYGLTLDELGPKYQAFTVKTEMKGLLDDWNSLIGAGADENAVLKKMAGSWSEVASQGLKYGTELDPALRPILQKLSDMGLLLDDQKHKIDLSKLAFAGPDAFLETAMGAIGKVSGAINDFPSLVNINFNANQTGDWPNPNDYAPGGSSGGSGGSQGKSGSDDQSYYGHPGQFGGAITPYGVQRLARGGPIYRGIGVDTVPLWGEVGEGMLSKLGMQALGRLNAGLGVGGGGVHLHLEGAYIDSDRRVQQITASVTREIKRQLEMRGKVGATY